MSPCRAVCPHYVSLQLFLSIKKQVLTPTQNTLSSHFAQTVYLKNVCLLLRAFYSTFPSIIWHNREYKKAGIDGVILPQILQCDVCFYFSFMVVDLFHADHCWLKSDSSPNYEMTGCSSHLRNGTWLKAQIWVNTDSSLHRLSPYEGRNDLICNVTLFRAHWTVTSAL